jgi:hypothetical protein
VTRLPGADAALVEERKVLGYLLNLAHQEGGPKARFFLGRGFSLGAWGDLAAALVAHARENEVTDVSESRFGTNHEVTCRLRTPDGRDPCIITVWEVRAGGPPRLITAYPNR